MEIDLAKKLAEFLGVDVEFTTVTAATRTELLDSGDIDCVMATFTITDERKQILGFHHPLLHRPCYRAGQGFCKPQRLWKT